ncbi:hypothetical protein IQ238_23840 [Pleurocapsales cyanobacterium LEGE 06147]|nr:hypothetical protein [Pleurocapsales cyanobacterium LEGE 06147]
MKRLVIGILSALSLTTIATPTLANEMAAVRTSTQNIVEITPFNLVSRAYQGSFAEQGIPSNAAFITAVHTRRVKAEDLVKGAISQGRLSPETISDRVYLNRVESFLKSLDRN